MHSVHQNGFPNASTANPYSQYLAGLIAPKGSFELDSLLNDCPEPAASLLDDNSSLNMWSFPARLFLGELLERAGMHEQALAQLQPALVFSPCNPRLKIRVWLLLGRCHVAMGQKVSQWRSASASQLQVV